MRQGDRSRQTVLGHADIKRLAKEAWRKAQGAARDEANGCLGSARRHWNSFNQRMSTVDEKVRAYLKKGCNPALIPGWVNDLLACYHNGEKCPGPDDPQPFPDWPSSIWQPVFQNPVWPPTGTFPPSGWPIPKPGWPILRPGWPPILNPFPIRAL